ncbi:hypothetical protein Kpol_1006p1, partial [Vanderwaltozyma polyspora DSM 70294]
MLLSQWLLTTCILISSYVQAADQFKPKVVRTESRDWFAIYPFDDSTVLLKNEDTLLSISDNNGETWRAVEGINDAMWCYVDKQYPKTRAFVSSKVGNKIYMTEDQGKTWTTVKINAKEYSNGGKSELNCDLVSHPTKPEILLAECYVCDYDQGQSSENITKRSISSLLDNVLNSITRDPTCRDEVFISTNSGKDFTKLNIDLKESEESNLLFTELDCEFAIATKQSKNIDEDSTIYCIRKHFYGHESNDENETRYLVSSFVKTSNWGKTFEELPELKGYLVNYFEAFDSQLLVITQDDAYNRHSTQKVWISKDFKTFKEAHIPTQLRFMINGLISEDSVGRLTMPILRSIHDKKDSSDKNEDNKKMHHTGNIVSDILISDSRGTKFTFVEWMNSDDIFSREISSFKSLKGTLFGYTQEYPNYGNEGSDFKVRLKSKVSVDNGNTWSNLKIVDPENKSKYSCNIDIPESCSLNIMSMFGNTKFMTAGIMMVNGAVSDGGRSSWSELNTFISRDGGLTWKLAFEFQTITAFGDYGNVIVAVPYDPESDDDSQSEFYYSLDQGTTWTEYQLEKTILPMQLISTTPDGSGLTFILNGLNMDSSGGSRWRWNDKKETNFVYSLDFSDAFEGKACVDSDLEKWYIAGGNCINGAKYSFDRRKADSKCLMRKLYEDLAYTEEICEKCSDDDYECSYEFVKDSSGKCVADFELLSLSGSCAKAKNGKISLKPKQRIVNTLCKVDMKIEDVLVPCTEVDSPENPDNIITVSENKFDSALLTYKYFDTASDESLLMMTLDNEVYVSHDGGKNIKKVNTNREKIVEIVFNPFYSKDAYLFGRDGGLYITHDRGQTFTKSQLPETRQLGLKLEFHATKQNTFIYYGGKDCDSMFSEKCHAVAYITTDGGETFSEMLNNGIHCKFSGSTFKDPYNEDQIICQILDSSNGKKKLVSSTNFFKSDSQTETLFEEVIGFMSTG